ncbi:MAG: SDR family oxidoreductase [Muribaculaceae bacterium]|nr:SDR family oxidoreductase [Muribaculaceae bacterium]
MRKSIFITGGASGIGGASAALFLERGWNVGVYDLNRTALVDGLTGEYGAGRFAYHGGDTRSAEALKAAAEETAEALGGLGAVFACAGVHHSDTLMDVSEDELRRVMEINIMGTFNTLRACIPLILKSGGGAVVINASDQSLIGKPHSFAYGLTKGALGQMTKSLALDLAGKGVRVNAICPGTIRTPMVDAIFARCAASGAGSEAELWAEEASLFPLGRVGEASEVARLVYFLASEESSFCTGGLYTIDGGLTAG